MSASDTGGRPSVIRLLRGRDPFDDHVCRGGVPRAAARVPLFRAIAKNGNLGTTPLSGAAIHKTIRRRGERAGYDATLVSQLGGHSLRYGFVTQAFRNGADAHAIMRQTGHSTPAMLERYSRENAPLMGNAVTEIGLCVAYLLPTRRARGSHQRCCKCAQVVPSMSPFRPCRTQLFGHSCKARLSQGQPLPSRIE